jgi:uncharacterized protein
VSNRLAAETSPYLQQHADNPVDWYPWGDEAFAHAAERDVAVLVSIGYSACHWCHVMERESFADGETAATMNRLFVNVKVDREERPDVDAVYMDAVVSLAGHGGWPLTVFLTPSGQPFYGGTYYPPVAYGSMPAFRDVLDAVADAYRRRPDDVNRQAAQLTRMISAAPGAAPAGVDHAAVMRAALAAAERDFDRRHGGFGAAPKFPPSPLLVTLLRAGLGDAAQQMATATLDAIADGGIHDQLAGGFHRYAVDARWLVPHFEKMLYDNALLVRAFLASGEARHADVARRALRYIERELRVGDGYAASQDADTDGHEGLTFVWTPTEITAVIDEPDATLVCRRFGITPDGNFDGSTVLSAALPLARAAEAAGVPASEAKPRLDAACERLLAARNHRPQPARDDKRLLGWNSFALAAFADASVRLGDSDALDAARVLARFLLAERRRGDGRLLRTERIAAFADDYGAFADGLIALHYATGELAWLVTARNVTAAAVALFAAGDGTFFLAGSDGTQLVARRRDIADTPTPSATSLIAANLLRLGRIWGDHDWVARAEQAVSATATAASRAPVAFGQLLAVCASLASGDREVAIIGAGDDPRTRDLVRVAVRYGGPADALVVADPADRDFAAVPLLDGRALVDGQPAAYVCERFACQQPVTTAAALAALLAPASR